MAYFKNGSWGKTFLVIMEHLNGLWDVRRRDGKWVVHAILSLSWSMDLLKYIIAALKAIVARFYAMGTDQTTMQNTKMLITNKFKVTNI